MSSANKDEGLKCLAIARRALAEGNTTKALKFAAKANTLYAGQPDIQQLLRELESMGGSTSETPSMPRAPSPTPSAASTDTASTAPVSEGKTETRNRTRSTSTSDQHDLVKEIRSKKCHYEVLMISRTAGDDEIKRAYRKLALKLHPDKNKAPGADEAFKMVSKAFSVLSNPQDRAHYDRYGDTEGRPRGPGGYGGFGGAGPRYAASFNGVEVDAEELFRMFFGGNPFMGGGFGGMGPQPRYRHQQQGPRYRQQQGPQYQHQHGRRYQHQQHHQSSIIRLLMSVAPIVMLLIFNLFSRGPAPYSLSQSREYPFPSATSAHRVPFYVADKSLFTKQYRPGSHERRILEHEIETNWVEITRRKCTQQQLVKARWVSYNQPEKAAKAPLNYCEELESRFS